MNFRRSSVLFLGCLLGCGGSTAARPTQSAATFSRIALADVQGLEGGQSVYVQSDGRGFVQAVGPDPTAPELGESRFELRVAPATMRALGELIASRNFFSWPSSTRPGMHDEAHPMITVVLASGGKHSAWRWERDRDANFQAFYAALQSLVSRASAGKPVYRGPWDRAWLPAGFQPVDTMWPPAAP